MDVTRYQTVAIKIAANVLIYVTAYTILIKLRLIRTIIILSQSFSCKNYDHTLENNQPNVILLRIRQIK